MQKKRLYTALSFFFCAFAAVDTCAQAPTINVPAANINAQSNFLTSNAASGNLTSSALVYMTLRASTAGFIASSPSGNPAIPLSAMRYKVNTINGVTQAGETTITLSGADQNIHYITANIGTIALGSDYTVVTAGTAWLAGTYAANLAYAYVTPATPTLTLVVPGYITANTAPAASSTMTVSSLAAFRTGGGVTASQSFDYYATVPTTVQIQAGQANFSFSTTEQYNAPAPTAAAGLLTSTPTGSSTAGSPVALSSSVNNTISIAGGIPVPLTNKITFNNTLSLTPASLKSQFTQAGTYTLPFVYTIAKTSAYAIAATGYTANSNVQLTVQKLSELTVPGGTTASFNFNTAASYNQGLTALLSNPVTLSSTVPYTVTVKASSNFTSGANSIPAGVAIVEGSPAETGAVNSIVLSTSPQTLISNSNPVIDRAVNLQFRIPSTQTSNLLAKPAGTYTTNVTFTIVAP